MKHLFVAIVVALTLGSIGSAQAKATDYKLAVVNIQEVLDQIDQGKKAKDRMEKAMLSKKREVENKKKEYDKLEEDFNKQKLILSPSALGEKEKEIQVKRMELQQFIMQAQGEMQKKEMELTGGLLKKIQAIVGKIGKQGGYDFVWEKSHGGVVYFKDAHDLTKKVIDQYNKTYKK